MIKYQNAATSSVFVLPRDVEKHLKNASCADLRVIMYIFANGGNTCAEADMARELSLSEGEVYEALAFWRGAGIITYTREEKANVSVVTETPVSQRTTEYSASELANAIEGNDKIRELMTFASQKIGKILTPTEQSCIYSLVDSLGLECDLVMGIIEYCVSMDKKGIRYIERTAARMRDEDGIDTFEKFEEYIAKKTVRDSFENMVRRIIGAQNRGFTKKEREIIAQLSEKEVGEDLISAAYERTINSISKPSLSYMFKIIENWLSKGITSAQDLEGEKPFDDGESSMAGFRFEDFLEGPGIMRGGGETK
ncbi:MAG: DnaD domain protein [Clostridia bacterium]|nr:DnaD domain protein [Clostridia bacterium]